MLQPKISFVVPARNDNYGLNFLHRMQVFVNCLLVLADRHGLDAELVVVEWNPPKENPRLAEALTWPSGVVPGRVRIIEVPEELHRRLPNSDRIGLFEYIAKNVGIRRAKGQYVLGTNADILFSQELIEFLATGSLSPDRFYRIARHDVGAEVPLDLCVDEQLRFCAANCARVHSMWGRLPVKLFPGKNYRMYKEYLRKFSPQDAMHWFTSKFRAGFHTGAAGDFTMLSRQHWHSLRGYPELSAHGCFTDVYMCSMAKNSGLSQVVLKSPMRIYHQDHDTAEMSARPRVSNEVYWECEAKMRKTRKPIILNDETWAMANEALPEALIGA